MFTTFRVHVVDAAFARRLDRTLREGDLLRLVVDAPAVPLTLCDANGTAAMMLEPTELEARGKHATGPLYDELVRQLGVDDDGLMVGPHPGDCLTPHPLAVEADRCAREVLAELDALTEMDRFVGRDHAITAQVEAVKRAFGRPAAHARSLLPPRARGHAFLERQRVEEEAERAEEAARKEAEAKLHAKNTKTLGELGLEGLRVHVRSAEHLGRQLTLGAPQLVDGEYHVHLWKRLEGWEAPPGASFGSMTFLSPDDVVPVLESSLEDVRWPIRDIVGLILLARERDLKVDRGPVSGPWSDDPGDEAAVRERLNGCRASFYRGTTPLDPRAYVAEFVVEWSIRHRRVAPDLVAAIICDLVDAEHRAACEVLRVPRVIETSLLGDGSASTRRVREEQEVRRELPRPDLAWSRQDAERVALKFARTGQMSPRPPPAEKPRAGGKKRSGRDATP